MLQTTAYRQGCAGRKSASQIFLKILFHIVKNVNIRYPQSTYIQNVEKKRNIQNLTWSVNVNAM